jgi:hypothetical protein
MTPFSLKNDHRLHIATLNFLANGTFTKSLTRRQKMKPYTAMNRNSILVIGVRLGKSIVEMT